MKIKNFNFLLLCCCLSAGILFFGKQTVKAQNATTGKDLFTKTCTACHKVGGGKLVGPDLKGVTTRRKEDWLLKFIKSSQTMVKSGDKTAVQVFNENNKIIMPDQNLTPQQIKDILAYIKSVK